ncbi:SDR family NAD(P)-dependent oxidoreductase [Methylophaga pinxianii]|uniref:SDR family NAD(P)-dependent oxidoreductase n=1 Tax=Methylophaga pinxianii TaxID=2881052 RepID=UPI001CF40BB0|nr:SDR family NAD(P)-dependent oxidoreductase [Methylophaga pinxianii]MCB2427447.1 SDR family NAD(P)-dependent oxidoreductase [Methylophaga pinxianii]UPH44729.1 SDR family NAD(P)-dependent oxidoreductase [Methylophaga pinxianii]
MKSSVLVIGGSGQIAQAIIAKLLSDLTADSIVVVSRSPRPDSFSDVVWYQSEYDEASIGKLSMQFYDQQRSFEKVFICIGILHDDEVKPEKRLEQLTAAAISHVININTITPVLWLKHLLPVLKRSDLCQVTIFSARVGSIQDNQMGGWYSYRASKAALNTLLKSTAIEYGRRAQHVKLLAFHPGTTDSPLSRPYSANVPNDKLFSPDFVVDRLFAILKTLPNDGELSFLDWQGQPIQW